MNQVIRNAWQFLPGLYLSELLASSGVDAVTLDLQHGLISADEARQQILAIEARGAVPFARLPGVDSALIGSLLDAGMTGLICPSVESGMQAKEFVSACHYPPMGCRSFGPNRAILAHGADYVEKSAKTILTFAMIETLDGLESVGEIAATEHLTGLFIGPGDLGISMGIGPGQDRSEPEFLEAVARIEDAAARHGKQLGIHAATAEYAAGMAARGYRLVTVLSDTDLVSHGASDALKRFDQSGG